MWDSVLKLLLVNAAFVTLLAVPLSIPGWMSESGMPTALSFAVFVFGIALMVYFISAVIYVTWLTAEYSQWGFQDMIKGGMQLLLKTLMFVALNGIVYFLLSNAVPFYIAMDNTVGFAAVAVLFWVGVFWIMVVQYFFPIYCRMGDSFFKTWKKSILVALDNPGFSFFLLILVGISIMISSWSAFMFPGVFGTILLLQGATQLRLKKYDYLEENPDADRRRIPWRAVLQEDRTRVGKRSLRGMFFPWKE